MSRFTITQYGNNVVLAWPFGTLQSAAAVAGTYTNVSGALSPYTNAATGNAKFFRLQLQ